MILGPGLLLQLLLQAEWPSHQANGNMSSSRVNLRTQSIELRLPHGFSLSHSLRPLSHWWVDQALVTLPSVSRKRNLLLSPGFRAPSPLWPGKALLSPPGCLLLILRVSAQKAAPWRTQPRPPCLLKFFPDHIEFYPSLFPAQHFSWLEHN